MGFLRSAVFYKGEYQRWFLELPRNKTNTNKRELAEGFLEKLDDRLGSDPFNSKRLGTKKQNYTYQPPVRTPVCEDGQPDPEKHPYMKIKLLT